MSELPENGGQRKLKIHPLLSSLIQPVSPEEYEQLELDLIEFGCKEPILTWNGYILDGHKRYDICMKYNIPFKIKKSHLVTLSEAVSYVCNTQLQRGDDLKYELYKYLVGKWFSAQRELAEREAEFSPKTPCPVTAAQAANRRCQLIAKALNISDGTVNKYRFFQEAADTISKSAPQLGRRIITGDMKISHENACDLARRSPEELRILEKAVLKDDLKYLSHDDIRHEISWTKYQDQFSSPPAPKKGKELVMAQIKNMPQYDPDAEISSLAYTIPSWCSMITRSMSVSNLSQVSPAAKKRLLAQLTTLKSQTDRLLSSLKEPHDE